MTAEEQTGFYIPDRKPNTYLPFPKTPENKYLKLCVKIIINSE